MVYVVYPFNGKNIPVLSISDTVRGNRQKLSFGFEMFTFVKFEQGRKVVRGHLYVTTIYLYEDGMTIKIVEKEPI